MSNGAKDRPALEFREVTKASPCPICAGKSWCATTQKRADGSPGPVRCMRWDRAGVSIPAGWHASKHIAGDGGRMYVPDDNGKPIQYAEGRSVEEIDQEQSERAEKKKRRARVIWNGAKGRDTRHVEAYLSGRGIEISMLPGGRLPHTIRFNALCEDEYDPDSKQWTKAPAMVCAVQAGDRRGLFKGVHRTFLKGLDGGVIGKRDEAAKKQLGPCKGGSIRLNPDTTSGVLIVTEGIETALACLASTGVATLSAMDAGKLQEVHLPDGWIALGSATAAAVVIIAGDTDRSQAGQQAAEVAANRLRQLHPHLQVVVKCPTPEAAPNLVVRDGDTLAPAESAGKSVDWHDVFLAHGPEAVKAALLAGIDPKAARERASGLDVIQAAVDGPDRRAVAPPSVLERGRLYLLVNESPARKDRAMSGFLMRYWNGRFLQYTGRRYVEMTAEAVNARVWAWMNDLGIATRDGITALNPEGKDVADVVKAARGEVLIEPTVEMPAWLPESFDPGGSPRWGEAYKRVNDDDGVDAAPRKWIPFRNCLFDADAWIAGELKFKPHSPRYFSKIVLPYDLPIDTLRAAIKSDTLDALVGSLCPTWLQFLEGIYGEELQWHDTLQEWFGYNLIDDNSLEKMMVFVGLPRTGKGTVYAALGAVLGEDNVASTSIGELADRFGLAQLVGKSAAFLPDAHMSKFKDGSTAVERFKSITGNDPVAVEEKTLPRFTTRLRCRFTMACNEFPDLKDSSLGLASRMVVLKFGQSHLGREDVTLKDRIVGEAQGIMLWSLLGLRRLWSRSGIDRRFGQPTSSLELIEAIKREQSPVAAFVADACSVGPDHTCIPGDLFYAWQAWCAENSIKGAGTLQSFGRRLRATVPGLTETRPQSRSGPRQRVYTGISATPEFLASIPVHDSN